MGDGHEKDPSVEIINYKGAKYINVDTSTLDGIERAKDMNMIASNAARPEVVLSSYLLQISSDIYNKDNKGRAFTLLRHPIERAVSTYYFKLETGAIPNHVT